MATALEERILASNRLGCLGKAADDEPIFILRAQDKLFIPTLARWITMAKSFHVREDKIREAEDLYAAACTWQDNNPTKVKVPD